MKWVVIGIWALMTIILEMKHEITTQDVYIGASVILAADYIGAVLKEAKLK